MNPIATIRDLGIPAGSYVSAIRYLNDRPELTKDEYETLIKRLSGTSFKGEDLRESRYVFLYLSWELLQHWGLPRHCALMNHWTIKVLSYRRDLTVNYGHPFPMPVL